jgi:prenyltransferase beta subunit
MKRPWLLAVGLLAFAPSVFAQSADEKKATIAYLQKLQIKGSGFVAKEGDKTPTLPATSSAVRTLGHLGGDVPDRDGAAAFVARCFDDDGGFRPTPDGKATVSTTAVGAMAVVALKMPLDKYEGPVIKYLGRNAKSFDDIRIAVAGLESLGKSASGVGGWITDVAKLGNGDGTFGKGDGVARDTGGAVVALLRMGANVGKPEAILKALNVGQRKDGGFGKAETADSDLETTYRVMRCYHMLKAKPDKVEAMKKFLASCRNADGGYGVAPGQESNVSGTYYAVTVYHWLEE